MAQNTESGAVVAISVHLPDEIISQLLYYVSPRDNLIGFQSVSRRFHRIANEPLLWRHHCCSHFRFWHPRHRFHEKMRRRPLEETNWKRLFIMRISLNQRIDTLLDDIIATRVGRMRRFQRIAELGYDAKDFLLKQCQADPLLDDGLVRRHFSHAILDSIHRSIAVEEWCRLERVPDQRTTQVVGDRLERALGAFDLFVLHDQPGDLDDITRMLDDVASRFRNSQPDFLELTTRQRALNLLRWLRAQNLVGLQNPERDYRNLRNCLIGQALRHEEHESIPVISSAIFCCVASRLGIDGRCCAFPSHVHAIVFSSPGHTLDDVPLGPKQRNAPPERMFLDPYGSDDEIPLYVFQAMLNQLGWQDSMEELLAPTPAEEIANRTAKNLKATFAKLRNSAAHPRLSRLIRGDSTTNAKAGLYAASWATLMLSPPNTLEWVYQLVTFLRNFVDMWPEDAWLVEKYLLPPYPRNIRMTGEFTFHAHRVLKDPWRQWLNVREQDDKAPNVLRRQCSDYTSTSDPPFKIGQVFRHRRYGWTGVITSWSDTGVRQSSLAHFEEDEHRFGRGPDIDRRSFLIAREGNGYYFTCLPSDGSDPHVVVAANMELITDATSITEEMFPLAGRYFKRFDSRTCTFISNIREQFPDD